MTDEAMSFQVDGEGMEPSLVRIPSMGLSSAKSSMTVHRFRLHVPTVLLCKAAHEAWQAYAARSKAEDEKQGGPDPDDWVAVAGYPPLEHVIKDQDELDLLFGQGGSLLQSVMPKILGFDEWPTERTANTRWYYLDTWTIEKINDTVRWDGTCYSQT